MLNENGNDGGDDDGDDSVDGGDDDSVDGGDDDSVDGDNSGVMILRMGNDQAAMILRDDDVVFIIVFTEIIAAP